MNKPITFLAGLVLAASAWADVTGNITPPGQGGASSTGSLVVGSPSGGNQGTGSINAQSIFVNGVPVTIPTIGDTVREQATVTTASGSTAATISPAIAASYIGANIVIANAGPPGCQTITVTGGGTGYAVGDTITVAGGTSSAACVLMVLNETGGVIVSAAQSLVATTPGVYSVIPTGTLSQSASSGSGTGATFTATWLGTPLQTTIANVSGTSVTLGANAQNAMSAATTQVAYGHDDTAAIQSALNSGATSVIFPANQTFGQYSQLTLPNSHRVVIDFQGSILVALASMTNQLYQTANANFFGSEGSVIQNGELEGFGLASHNVDMGSYSWSLSRILYRNATTSNLLCTGQCENSYFTSSWIYNNSSVMQAYPAYCSDIEYTDNHMTDVICAGAAVSGIYDNGAGTYYTNVHVYNDTLGPDFNFHSGNVTAHAIYADGISPGQYGIYLNAPLNQIMGWQATYSGAYAGQIGLYCGNSTSSNVIGGGVTSLAVGDAIANCPFTSENFAADNVNGIINGNDGANIGGGFVGLNVNNNNNTFLNTGTANGTVDIGGGSGTVTINDATTINHNSNVDTEINGGNSTGTTTLGNSLSTLTINAGVVTGTGVTQFLKATIELQSALPLILAGGVTPSMGNNCAITGLATPTTYTHAYIYLPAGAIKTSSTAGWYYYVASSASAGTCYNNVWSSGLPRIPASPTAFVSTGPGGFTQSTSLISLPSTTIAGNSLGPNGNIEFTLIATETNTTTTSALDLIYGSQTIGAYTPASLGTSKLYGAYTNAGATGVQTGWYSSTSGASATIVRGTVDSTSDQALYPAMQLQAAADYMVLESYSIKAFPN